MPKLSKIIGNCWVFVFLVFFKEILAIFGSSFKSLWFFPNYSDFNLLGGLWGWWMSFVLQVFKNGSDNYFKNSLKSKYFSWQLKWGINHWWGWKLIQIYLPDMCDVWLTRKIRRKITWQHLKKSQSIKFNHKLKA